MRFKTKCEKIFIIVVITGLMLNKSISQAALQANSITHTSPSKQTGTGWLEQIRQMETVGQTMGLNETLNDDLSPNSSNNIDVHMMRTTEYGAMAILSVSGFGNPKTLSDVEIKSTTGNVTGVYIMGTRYEWTAGLINANSVKGKNERYYELYDSNRESAKIGDALGTDTTTNKGCTGWHSSGSSAWFGGSNGGARRGASGLFSYHNHNGTGGYSNFSTRSDCGRGVAVVGEGL